MTLPSGWATATRSYDDQGFPVSTGTTAPEAPPLAGEPQSQQNSKVGSKTAASSSGAGSSAGAAAPWLWLAAAPLFMFVAGVVVI